MSLLCNPLMGQISSMYSLSTKRASFGSRFDFNVYSYESDLSIGCEIWKYTTDVKSSTQSCSKQEPEVQTESIESLPDTAAPLSAPASSKAATQQNSKGTKPDSKTLKDQPLSSSKNLKSTDSSASPSSSTSSSSSASNAPLVHVRNPITADDTFFSRHYKTFVNALDRKLSDATSQLDSSNDQYIVSLNDQEDEQQELSLCFKGATSLKNQTVNMVWEGRFKELLVSTGFGLSFATKTPSVTTLGLAIQYSS